VVQRLPQARSFYLTLLAESRHFVTDFVAISFLQNSPRNRTIKFVMGGPSSGHAHRNLHRSLLANEELAGQVWEAWDKGEIDDQVAWLAWAIITHIDRFFYAS